MAECPSHVFLLNEPEGTHRARESCSSVTGGGHFPPVLFPASAQGTTNGRELESQDEGKKSWHKMSPE